MQFQPRSCRTLNIVQHSSNLQTSLQLITDKSLCNKNQNYELQHQDQ